ncbi:hypothetical protein [Reichenbachiella sp.]|uniref:hypothetical protein n=1 Tax=Reichenbachiella sp. TaxID=2184521 RepID=UPI003B598DFC
MRRKLTIALTGSFEETKQKLFKLYEPKDILKSTSKFGAQTDMMKGSVINDPNINFLGTYKDYGRFSFNSPKALHWHFLTIQVYHKKEGSEVEITMNRYFLYFGLFFIYLPFAFIELLFELFEPHKEPVLRATINFIIPLLPFLFFEFKLLNTQRFLRSQLRKA